MNELLDVADGGHLRVSSFWKKLSITLRWYDQAVSKLPKEEAEKPLKAFGEAIDIFLETVVNSAQ